jgi:3-hydroxyisobutyrate dehydrogenase-like beta-hydroxyacid dehydrogenase
LIGFGEVGALYGSLIKEQNWQVILYDHRFCEDSKRGLDKRNRAETLGLPIASTLDQLARNAKYILSIVTPSSAAYVAREITQYMTENHIYVDLNSTNPEVKKQSYDLLKSKGTAYLDGVIMGSPVMRGVTTPIYYSGEMDLAASTPLATLFNLKKVGMNIGQASAIKMSQSIVTKGLQALILEQVMLSSQWEVQGYVSENLDKILTKSYSYWLEYALTTNVVHSARRVEEMTMVVDLLKGTDLNAFQSEATCATLQWIADKRIDPYSESGSKLTHNEILKRILPNVKKLNER